MPIQIIHVSDIHFGSGENHGRLNPNSGLNSRFEDFVDSFNKVCDFSIENQVDCLIFAGDAYKTANPEPIYQKYFASCIKKLSQHKINTILLVGNHDQILKSTKSHALSVFDSLKVEYVRVIDKPVLTTVKTKNGDFQLIGLPHITKNILNTNINYQSLGNIKTDEILIGEVTKILNGFYNELNPNVPTVVTAHMTVDKAVSGIEEELLLGYSLTYPTSIFMDNRVDYVALGHVHKHQVINQSHPAIVYCGSVDRVDFGEEGEDKGFVKVNLDRLKTNYSFHSLNPRPFKTLDIDLKNIMDPASYLINKINSIDINGCVLRVKYTINSQNLNELAKINFKDLCRNAFSYRLIANIEPDYERVRMPGLTKAILESPKLAITSYLKENLNLNNDELTKFVNIINDLNAEILGEKE